MSDLIKMWNYVQQIEYTNKLMRITLDIHCSKLRYIYCWLCLKAGESREFKDSTLSN